jgi:hypothetical protein
LVVAACLTGCFTDPVNMSPIVRIDAPTPFFLGQPKTFTATVSDPDGDTADLMWARVTAPCHPGDSPPSDGWTPSLSSGFTVPPKDTVAEFCVWARASDQYGATSFDHVDADPQDRAPMAALDLASPADAPPFMVHTQFVLSADASSDPDPGDSTNFTFDWSLMMAPPLATGLEPCPGRSGDSKDAHRCLTADVAGDYQILVTVTDPGGQKSTAEKWLHVVTGQLGTPAIDLVSPGGSGPYALGSLFQVTGMSSAGANLSFNWTYDPPPGADKTSSPCNDPKSQCFTANVSGKYRIGLSVTNEAGTSSVEYATFVVEPDQPPCIDQVSPDSNSITILTKDETFEVDLVFDDLDPFPPTKDMQWFESDDGGAFRLVESNFPSHTLHYASYIPGDEVRLRLEVSDRETQRSADGFAACKDDDVCTEPNLIHPNACFQRVTWTVKVQ